MVATLSIGGMAALPSEAGAARPALDFSTDSTLNNKALNENGKMVELFKKTDGVRIGGTVIRRSGIELQLTSDLSASGAAALKKSIESSGVPVSIVKVTHSTAELDQVTAELNGKAEAMRSKGLGMSYWGPDVESNTVSVTLKEYSPNLAAKLMAEFPGKPISVRPVSD